MSRVGWIAAGLLVAAGVALAVIPFSRPRSISSVTYAEGTTTLSANCAPPIVSAWSDEDFKGGWFGYAPTGDGPPPFVPPLCRPTAQDRIQIAGALWLGAIVVLVLTRTRRPRLGTVAPA